MKRAIIFFITSSIYIQVTVAKELKTETIRNATKIEGQANSTKVSTAKNEIKMNADLLEKAKKNLDQINIRELETIVTQVSKKYQAQLQKPKDINSFLKALQGAQEEIVNKYLEKNKL